MFCTETGGSLGFWAECRELGVVTWRKAGGGGSDQVSDKGGRGAFRGDAIRLSAGRSTLAGQLGQ